jgi:hypothetical protein
LSSILSLGADEPGVPTKAAEEREEAQNDIVESLEQPEHPFVTVGLSDNLLPVSLLPGVSALYEVEIDK